MTFMPFWPFVIVFLVLFLSSNRRNCRASKPAESGRDPFVRTVGFSSILLFVGVAFLGAYLAFSRIMSAEARRWQAIQAPKAVWEQRKRDQHTEVRKLNPPKQPVLRSITPRPPAIAAPTVAQSPITFVGFSDTKRPNRIASPAPINCPTWQVQGAGKELQDAYEDALGKARERVIAFLRQQSPPVEWAPDVDFVRDKLIKDKRQNGVLQVGGTLGDLKQVTLTVAIGPEAAAEILTLDRHARMEERMKSLLIYLGGAVAILAAVAGCIRLEELTKGYYTGWIKLAAVGIVAAVLAFLVFLP